VPLLGFLFIVVICRCTHNLEAQFNILSLKVNVKVKQSHYWPGEALGFPGG
jgi:hypothetical protein